ncbi:hypothetical protein [Permianibacter aggregans]|uniref:NIPSNAP protein n=1 Tax=Permianibacter aggregans TaxID=1510150 RepID=A0A4R6UMM7_9GAMM|nr:hypothetical protein [Permianibacter aggregans]QGX40193.1 hypothetical protein E2H98_11130 [Permianibacter aggregans]TDQ47446.1 hypothetical protein EV696_11038 [Permianibacter aggregans]
MKCPLFLSAILAVALPLASLSVAAEKDSDANLSEIWVMKIERGKALAFETAFKLHLDNRKESGDPRAWQTWTAVTGDELRHYYVRYCCFAWDELDRYEQWVTESKIMDDWRANVDQLVKGYEHHFARVDMANSHWPEGEHEFAMVGISHYVPKMGSHQSLERTKKTLSDAAKAMKWPYYWAWDSTVNGKPGLSLVVPYKNYAGMASSEQSFSEMLAKHLGSEKKATTLLNDWMNNFEAVHYEIYRWRKDMSMPMKE